MAVSSKKDKLIEEAQKFALRGQFDKAAKAYEQVLAAEPAAINLRQKLAEMLIKCGKIDDARKELETIGKHFTKNGFYLKAIAVYKQLQKLFPADISLSLTLAELNEKHGLIANSLSEYKLVYEFHDKNGNSAEALGILDRMQNVDPQNIPIKIKFAEACAQQGKMNEAYAVFAKTAALLLERGDNATLSKVCARVQQTFPDRPDFMFEVLSEQTAQGNAATAIDNIQNLLRSNPHNKPAWDLIIKAYKQLGQPQRVKMAYQHYLNFFPTEPAAMLGLISSVVAEKDLAGALVLLDEYESTLISADFLQQLEEIYNSLDKIDPISIRVLDGLIRVAVARGDETEVGLLTSKRHSLCSVTSNSQPPPTDHADTDVFFGEQQVDTNGYNNPLFVEENPFAVLESPSFAEAEQNITTTQNATSANVSAEEAWPLDEEIEIDIDIDTPFDSIDQATDSSADHENWLESVGDLFDSISTAPRGVKFGDEMEGSDAQSHFDLGQAFKEMGLFDEAINEFRQASQDASRQMECLIMQCACLRERGDVEKSITMLQSLLKPGLSEEQGCAVKYELATGYEAAGKQEEANTLLNEIHSTNPDFRDIHSRLHALNQLDSLDFSDEDLQDF